MPPPFIAVDLGGTSLRAARFEGNNPNPAQIEKSPSRPERGPEALIGSIVEHIKLVAGSDLATATIGVGVPGPLDPSTGIIIESPNLPGWDQVPLKARLEVELDRPVAVGNDANLAAVGEWRHGAGERADHMIYVTVSTGIGGGIISRGKLLTGARGLAGEVGHIVVERDGPLCGCGQAGHLEAVASGPALARRYRAMREAGRAGSLSGEPTAEKIASAAQNGDQLARQLIHENGRLIGHHLTSLLHLFNPQVIVIGGGLSEIGSLLLDPLQASLEEHVMYPAYLEGLELRRAKLGDNAGLVGAMVLASRLDE